MALMIRGTQFDVGDNSRSGRKRKLTRSVFGSELSLSLSVVEPGYRSDPNVHVSEEICTLVEGELSFFLEGQRIDLKTGGFVRIPKMCVHWIENTSPSTATLIQSHCPAMFVSYENPDANVGLLERDENLRSLPSSPIRLSRSYQESRPEFPQVDSIENLSATAEQVLESLHFQMASAGRLTSKFVYGLDSNLMVATRVGGYHSKSHVHDCEQLNLLLEGELWVFLENEAFFMKPGDFLRIPRGRHHWAWNTGGGRCVLVENHSPVLNPAAKPNAKALLTERESKSERYFAVNYWSPDEIRNREEELMRSAQFQN